MLDNAKMQGRRVLVTGAGTGIGMGIARQFAAKGALVALHYSRSATGARAMVEQIRTNGGRAESFHADFTDLRHVRRLAEEAAVFLGGVDVLVNNAGITMNQPFAKVSPDQFDTLYHVNVRAMFFLTQAVVPAMVKEGGGCVINLTSVHAYSGMTEHTVYAGTKAAIVAFTRTLSLELAPKGIRVNAIAPGWVLVENHFKAVPDLDPKEHEQNIPAGFVAEPDDIGHLAVFLASDEARYIIGQTIVADGGQMAIMPNTGDFRAPRTASFGRDYVPGL